MKETSRNGPERSYKGGRDGPGEVGKRNMGTGTDGRKSNLARLSDDIETGRVTNGAELLGAVRELPGFQRDEGLDLLQDSFNDGKLTFNNNSEEILLSKIFLGETRESREKREKIVNRNPDTPAVKTELSKVDFPGSYTFKPGFHGENNNPFLAIRVQKALNLLPPEFQKKLAEDRHNIILLTENNVLAVMSSEFRTGFNPDSPSFMNLFNRLNRLTKPGAAAAVYDNRFFVTENKNGYSARDLADVLSHEFIHDNYWKIKPEVRKRLEEKVIEDGNRILERLPSVTKNGFLTDYIDSILKGIDDLTGKDAETQFEKFHSLHGFSAGSVPSELVEIGRDLGIDPVDDQYLITALMLARAKLRNVHVGSDYQEGVAYMATGPAGKKYLGTILGNLNDGRTDGPVSERVGKTIDELTEALLKANETLWGEHRGMKITPETGHYVDALAEAVTAMKKYLDAEHIEYPESVKKLFIEFGIIDKPEE